MNNSSIFVDGFVLWLKCVTLPTNSQSLPIFAIFGIFWIISEIKDTYSTNTHRKKNESAQIVPREMNWNCVAHLLRCDKSIFRTNLNISLFHQFSVDIGFQQVSDVFRIEFKAHIFAVQPNDAKNKNETRTCKTNIQNEWKNSNISNWICNWLYKMPAFMIIAFLVFNMLHFVRILFATHTHAHEHVRARSCHTLSHDCIE